jgi:hypothetical protein
MYKGMLFERQRRWKRRWKRKWKQFRKERSGRPIKKAEKTYENVRRGSNQRKNEDCHKEGMGKLKETRMSNKTQVKMGEE